MVVGGYADDHKPFNKVEIIDLSNQNLTCSPVPDFPYAEYGSVGTYINNRALVCGGFNIDEDIYYSDCYSYEDNVSNHFFYTMVLLALQISPFYSRTGFLSNLP